MTAARVLFVSHTSEVSGAEFVLLDIAGNWPGAAAFVFESGALSDRLARLGLSVAIARHGSGLNRFRRDGSPFAALAHAGTFFGLIRELARQAANCDLIYANSQKAFTLSAIAAWIARRPLIWHLHDILDAAHFSGSQRSMQTWLANRCAAAVIVPSEAAAAAFRAAGGRSSLVQVIPNGRSVTPDARSKAMLRADLLLPAGPLVGVFSRLATWKGQDVVIRALKDCPDLTCILVGDALFGEDEYAGRLKALAHELGLGDRVLFLGRRDDVPALMQAMDLMVHPSIDPEPFGLTLVEAMSVGVPIVASDAGASREILDDGRCGTIVAAGDAVALAHAIQMVLSDPVQSGEKAHVARQRAGLLYTVGRMQMAVADVIATHVRKAAPCS